MNIVQVAYCCVDQGLKWSSRDSLENTRPEKARIVRSRPSTPSAGNNQKNSSEDEKMALAPYTGGGNEEKAGDADAQEKVSRQLGYPSERGAEVGRQLDRVGGENGTQCGREDGRRG